MASNTRHRLTRRQFLCAASIAALAPGVGTRVMMPRQARAAQQKTLQILQWRHFVPGYDRWFNETYTKAWGERHDTRVLVENVGQDELNSRAAAEVAAQTGHDLFLFVFPQPVHEDQVIDHRELYEECAHKYGKAVDIAIKSTYNPTTKKFFGFSSSYVPFPINYRKDLWDTVGMSPNTWEDIRRGGRRLKLLHEAPVGIGLASETDSHMALRSIMYAFGAAEQDSDGTPVLKSKETLEALAYVKALYQEAMTAEVPTWDAASDNNRFMLSGTGCLAMNAISIPRTAEKLHLPVGEHIWLAKAPQGPVRRLGLPNTTDVYIIWKFAANIEGAKQFLVDYIGNYRQAFLAAELYNFPCFPDTVPDLAQLLAKDAKATPPDKYKVLTDVLDWTTNVGHPGHANAAIAEIINTGLISTMFAQAATGKVKPDEALRQADAEVQRIYQQWKARGKL